MTRVVIRRIRAALVTLATLFTTPRIAARARSVATIRAWSARLRNRGERLGNRGERLGNR
jgi:hypothetical protein